MKKLNFLIINPLTMGTCNAGQAKPAGQKCLSDLLGKHSQDPEVKGLRIGEEHVNRRKQVFGTCGGYQIHAAEGS
jgi:hypothetical protein